MALYESGQLTIQPPFWGQEIQTGTRDMLIPHQEIGIQSIALELIHKLIQYGQNLKIGIEVNGETFMVDEYVKEHKNTLIKAYNNLLSGKIGLVNTYDIDLHIKDNADPDQEERQVPPDLFCSMMLPDKSFHPEYFGGVLIGDHLRIFNKQDRADIANYQGVCLILHPLNQLYYKLPSLQETTLEVFINDHDPTHTRKAIFDLLYCLVNLQKQYEKFHKDNPDVKLLTQEGFLTLKMTYPSETFDIIFS